MPQPFIPRDRFSRYQWIDHALMAAGIPIAALKAGTKKLAAPTARESLCRDVQHVEIVMDELGLNIGAITHQKDLPGINPLGFADLDIDEPGHGCDLSHFKFKVCRKGEPELGHYWFRVPDPAAGIVASYHGTHDVCTWNTVLPGSVHKDGSLYEFWVKEGDEWVPFDGQPFSVDMLPVIDPDQFRTKNQLAGCDEGVADGGAAVTRPRAAKKVVKVRKQKVWVPASGSPATRLKKARFYCRGAAWKAVSGMSGHSALLVVICNLRLYFGLPLSLVMTLVKEHYNPRCIDGQGNPAPWSDKEIEHKFDEAGKEGMYPTLGVKDPKAKAKAAAQELQGEVAVFLDAFTLPGGSCSPTALREAFIAFRSGEDVNPTSFGLAMRALRGGGSRKPGGIRAYSGLHLSEAGIGLTRSSLDAKVAA